MNVPDASWGAIAARTAYLETPRTPRFWASERPAYAFDELDRAEIHRCYLDAAGRRWVVPECRFCGRAHSFPVERLSSGVSWRPLQHHVIDGQGFWLLPTPNRRAEAFFAGAAPQIARKCRGAQE